MARPLDAALFGLAVRVGIQVISALSFRFCFFNVERELARRPVRAHSRHLPAYFYIRSAGVDHKTVAFDLSGDDGLSESADDCELIAEVAVQRLEPVGQAN